MFIKLLIAGSVLVVLVPETTGRP